MNARSQAAGQTVTVLSVTSATMPVRRGIGYTDVPCLASCQITATGRNQ